MVFVAGSSDADSRKNPEHCAALYPVSSPRLTWCSVCLFQMRLWNKYKVTSVPSLVFVDAATGKVVCRNGLLVVRDDPKGEAPGAHPP